MSISDSHADTGPQFGQAVDSACLAFNGTTPFTDQGCALCHVQNRGTRVEPQWTWWRNGDLTNFCPQPAPNQAPNGLIDSPAANQTITVGDAISFAGTGTDSDGNTPLSYNWNFGGGAPGSNLQDPGAVTFNSVGTFTVTFTVTDSLGLSDPTPPTRVITVNEAPQNCTDADGDGFAIEGGGCGPVDCNDSNAAINPGATEICTDGIDNNCNALVDAADPAALNCPTGQTCRDNDRDGFSPDGGVCGPIDCNDQDAATSPGATEACNDNRDNDCDGATDAADEECNGSDCVGQLIPEPELPLDAFQASWNAGERELDVEGNQAPAGAQVIVTNPDTGELLGVEVVESTGQWEFEQEGIADSEVPCRVRVEIGNRSRIQAVANAPADCRGGAEPPPEPEPNQAPNGVIDSPAGNRSITAGQAITFAGTGTDSDGNTPLRYSWNFGGGAANTTDQDPGSVVFATAGTYTVTFTVTDSLGLSDPTPATRIITVTAPNQAPNGVIDSPAGNRSITAGQAVSFAGTGTDSDGNTPLSYSWNFGGGAANSSAQDPGSVVFATAGTYTVAFTVTDSLGLSDPTPATRIVTVTEPEPNAELNVTAATWNAGERELDVEGNQAPAGAQVIVRNADTDELLGTAVVDSTGQWEFERGGLADSEVPCRVQVELGDQVAVRAVANAPADCRDGAGPPPEPEPNQAPNGVIDSPAGNRSITAGQAVAFTGTGTDSDGDTPLSYSWNFGGGAANTTAQDPGSVVFATAGTYTVTFTVTDSLGLSDPTPSTRIITVAEPPAAVLNITRARWDRGDRELKVEGNRGPAGARVTFRNADTGDLLGTTTVEGNGEWEFELRLRSRQVPCRVRVELGGQTAVRSVDNAPRRCVGNPES